MRQQIVIIGAGMVAQRFLQAASRYNLSDVAITVVGDEPYFPYDRIRLGYQIEQGLDVGSLQFEPCSYATYRIGNGALAIDPQKRTVDLSDGSSLSFTKLILATGASARRLNLCPPETKGVFALRSFADAAEIHTWMGAHETCVIVGGGVLGIELAENLRELGKRVTLVEAATHLAASVLDADSGQVVARALLKRGIDVRVGVSLKKIEIQYEQITSVTLADDVMLSTETLIYAIGTRPNSTLAHAAGIQIAANGGIVVNSYCQTSLDGIYALGDCASLNSHAYGVLAPGYAMAESLAMNLLSSTPKPVSLPIESLIFKTRTIPIATFGLKPSEETYQALTHSDPFKPLHKTLYVNNDGTELLGGVLIGDTSDLLQFQQICAGNAAFPSSPTELLRDNPHGMSATSLSDSSVICSCRGVTKGDIRRAIDEKGITSVAELKQETGAGTGCGGCLPTLTKLLRAYAPKADADYICEHFSYSRQELFHLIRTKKIASFAEMIRLYGKGSGCEICKPLIASIFASLWAGHVLEGETATLQDTNDRHLGNIQKNGTYSVIPMIPGGEISAEKLEVLTSVAKKYRLYIKITGAQRIALFGAQLEDLPTIWEELGTVGFESGHAYGKSLRTVKSCVGSRWCRFGLGDSTQLAIDLELRYQGLRSPHKLKSAVSGCARECAEAKSKDFGVIATMNGWNLYVCGNGGINPQHGLLLAGDLDKELLFRYLDRFLMFYIRTASKLERTATWFQSLDGGIEYLRSVIIHDSLGIVDELEADMKRVRHAYRDEWTEVIKDPQKRLLFKKYINSAELPSSLGEDEWIPICLLETLPLGGGAPVRWKEQDLAIFRTSDDVIFAIDNIEPKSGASVMARGILGDHNGRVKVASPIYKQSFYLDNGESTDVPNLSIKVYQTKIIDGWVWIGSAITHHETV